MLLVSRSLDLWKIASNILHKLMTYTVIKLVNTYFAITTKISQTGSFYVFSHKKRFAPLLFYEVYVKWSGKRG